MPRFSLKDWVLGIALMAGGVLLLYADTHWCPHYADVDMPTPAMLSCAFGGMSLMGAGIFAPFKHPFIGALLGFLLPILLIIATIIHGGLI
jgi:hypothetical protein